MPWSFAWWGPIWAERRGLTWSSAWWTWAAAVATWSSKSASSVSSLPLWMQRAASSSSFSWPSSPYTVPATRYTCRGGTAFSSGLVGPLQGTSVTQGNGRELDSTLGVKHRECPCVQTSFALKWWHEVLPPPQSPTPLSCKEKQFVS